MQSARSKSLLASLLVATCLAYPAVAVADCPSLVSKGVDRVAEMLLLGSPLVFVGKIEHQQFLGDVAHLDDPNAAIDITYAVEKVFKGRAGPTITLRTPFFCEACSISNDEELKKALDADVGRRVIVYVADEVDRDGRRRRTASGGCPAAIDADGPDGKDLVAAFERISRKHR